MSRPIELSITINCNDINYNNNNNILFNVEKCYSSNEVKMSQILRDKFKVISSNSNQCFF